MRLYAHTGYAEVARAPLVAFPGCPTVATGC